MRTNEYTPERAEQLLPILRSIAREIEERAQTIDQLEGILDATGAAIPQSKSSNDQRVMEANLAQHRRELRFAKQELGRYGCTLDEDHPPRILIPGEDGTLASGYAWNPHDEGLFPNAVQHAS